MPVEGEAPGGQGEGSEPTRSLPVQGAGGGASLPARIGHYHVKRLIGSGGMGTVYEAVQEHPRRVVALKVMRPGITSRSALRRFQHESQVLGRLRHPAIAQVYEAGTHVEGGVEVPYFAMEYVPNARSITEYAADRKLTTRQRLELFATVCAAIHHGHMKGIIHRDLKPRNILVDPNGQVKVIDFGVARTTDADMAVTSLQTDVGQLLGTLQYMSPEQVEADPHVIDARSDIYSLGVVLYELLVHRLPYDVTHVAMLEAARIIKEDAPTRLSTADAALGGDIETIALTALNKDPARRYQSADQLARDIERYLEGEPIIAHRPTLAYLLASRGRALMHRHPAAALALAAVVAVVAGRFAGELVLYHWTPAFDLYKRFLTIAPWPRAGPPAFRDVRVVRITDETAARIEDLALAEGLEGVTAQQWRSLRRLHGRLMERLASAGVRSVTWDIAFGPPSEFDEDFARGAKALGAAGADVVVSLREWPLDDGARPGISETILPHVRWGGATTKFKPESDWNLHLFAQRDEREPCPSLTLASLAAYEHPGRDVLLTVERHGATRALELNYLRQRDPAKGRGRASAATELIELTAIEPYAPVDGEPFNGRRPGDMIGVYVIEVPPDERLEEASVDYEWVFETPAADVRKRLGGKAIAVGDCRTGNDVFRHPDGRLIGGVYGHAAGLERLLRGGALRAERDGFTWAALGAGAAMGLVAAVAATGRARRRAAILVAAAILLFFASVFSYHELRYLFNPLMPLLAMVVACELAVGVNRVRRARAG